MDQKCSGKVFQKVDVITIYDPKNAQGPARMHGMAWVHRPASACTMEKRQPCQAKGSNFPMVITFLIDIQIK